MKKHPDQNHPSEQEWMEYLYDEMGSPQRGALEAHVKDCPPCREKREGLRGTQQTLDQWEVVVPPKHQLATTWQPVVKWAAAAVLLVSTAFATGRMSRPPLDVAALQAQIAKPIEEKVQQQALAASQRAMAAAEEKMRVELRTLADKALAEATAKTKEQLEQLATTLAALRVQDKSEVAAALEDFQNERMADYLKIRADLERVALFSQSVAQFASYTPPQREGEPQAEQQAEQ
jgi:hypothetical protein